MGAKAGGLDFALLKPIDTQFLVSLQRIDWSSAGNFVFGLVLLVYSLFQLDYVPGPIEAGALPGLSGLRGGDPLLPDDRHGGHQHLAGAEPEPAGFLVLRHEFARYPMEIYGGRFGTPLRRFFTFIIPILVAVNVPAVHGPLAQSALPPRLAAAGLRPGRGGVESVGIAVGIQPGWGVIVVQAVEGIGD